MEASDSRWGEPANLRGAEFEPPRQPLGPASRAPTPPTTRGSANGSGAQGMPGNESGSADERRAVVTSDYISRRYPRQRWLACVREAETDKSGVKEGCETQKAAERGRWPRPRPAQWKAVLPPSKRVRLAAAWSSLRSGFQIGDTSIPHLPTRVQAEIDRDGRQDVAAIPRAAPVRSARSVAARGGRLHTLFGQWFYLHAAGRPEGVFLPAHAPEGIVGDRIPSKCGSGLAFLGPGRTTWSPLTYLEKVGQRPRWIRGGSPGKLACLAQAYLSGAPGSLELTSLASPKIDTYPLSSLSSGRKEASTGDVNGVTLCFLIPPSHFKLVYIPYSSEKFAVRGWYTFFFIIGRSDNTCLTHSHHFHQIPIL